MYGNHFICCKKMHGGKEGRFLHRGEQGIDHDIRACQSTIIGSTFHKFDANSREYQRKEYD